MCVITYAYADTSSSLGRLQRPAGYINKLAIGSASYADVSRSITAPMALASAPAGKGKGFIYGRQVVRTTFEELLCVNGYKYLNLDVSYQIWEYYAIMRYPE